MTKAIEGQRGQPGTLRRGLMLYGSTAALAAALMLAEGGVGPALAQEIGPRINPNVAAQGDFTVPGPSPSPSFEYRSGTLDIVHMNRDAVLNWTTYDTAAPGGARGNSYVNFLPERTELRFVGNGESFTAINRVFTTPDNAGAYRGIALQGQVTSYLFGDGPGSVGPVGGNVWFYSPGGILATGSASFNVGSLLLSASDLENFVENGNARLVDFTGVADPFAAVILQMGARVNLTEPNSGFAIVAPTIVQAGEVSVNGSVLYLSAESGHLVLDNLGQFYATAIQDAQPGNEIRHLGTTTGPASLSSDNFSVYDPQAIEFRTGRDVGVLLSGSLGYAAATNAAFGPNGSIALTAGQVSTAGDLSLTSDTYISANEVNLTAGSGNSIVMGGDPNGSYLLSVLASEATFEADVGGLLDFAGLVAFETFNGNATFRVVAEGNTSGNAGGRISVGELHLNSTSQFAFQQGGDILVTIGNGGSVAVGGAMTLSSNGYALEDDNGTWARGGRAVLTMTGANANLAVGGDLTLSAQGLPFPSNCECFPPPSGSATGGYAAFTATGGTIEAGNLNVSASAEAFHSFYVEPGAILDATGGTALVDLGDSTASLLNISVSAEAQGASASPGADGGAGFGGTASFSKGPAGTLATQGIVVTADASGGDGSGPDGQGFPASRGGNAAGGTASISLAQNAEGLGYLDLSATAQAGTGGSATEFSAESGADGGDAIGGDAVLTLSGAGTNLDGVIEGSLNMSASAGEGGDGEADYNNGVQSGDGGNGGGSIGGSLLVIAVDGAEFSWSGSFGLTSVGGSGGSGGDQVVGEGGPSGIGRGGRGGDALGATVSIVADGGTIAGHLEINANPLAGEGGLDGFDRNNNYTGDGEYGVASGGSVTLIARDNGASRFAIDYAALEASGDVAGSITIADETTDAGASMHFGSLFAEARGEPAGAMPAVQLSAVRNAVVVDGTAELYGNSIALDFTGSGRLETGYALLSTQNGDIAITHADNPGVLSLHSSGPVEVYANGNYNAGAGSMVASGDYTLIRTTGSIFAHDTRGLTSVSMHTQGNATVANVMSGGNFELFAGRLEGDGFYAYQPDARATITGTVVTGGSVLVESGGFAEFASGSNVRSDNDIAVRTGDDIVVASGASLVSDIDPYDGESIHLLAGDIDFGFGDGDLIEPIGSPIASLVIAGSLDTNGASLYLTADAIDASTSSIATGNLYVDVTDAPPFGPYSNDAGLLPAGCTQGSACLGNITATRDVAIGLASNNGLISLRTGGIDFTGDHFDVATLDRLDLNPGNVPSNLTAGQRISLRSANDAVALTGVTLDAPVLRLSAGTDLAAATATLISPNTIEIDVGNDILVGTIVAGGLDDGSESSTFAAPGNFLVDSLTYGGSADMRITANGDLTIGFADSGGRAIDLATDDALFLGSTAATSGAVRLQGDSVGFNNLRSSGLVYVRAGEGGISGVSEGPPVIDTTGGVALESTGAIDVGDMFADADIAISGANVATGLVSAGGALAVTAEGAGSVGSFSSGGSTVFSGASFDVGGGFAGSFLAIQATDGDLSFSTLGAAGAGTLQATGALLGGDIGVGGALSLIGGSMAIGGAEAAAGIDATIDGDASFIALSSSAGPVSVTGGGDVFGTIIAAATDVSLSGGQVGVSNVSAGRNLLVDASSLAATTLSAGSEMTLTLEDGAFIGAATAGHDLTLSADNGVTAGSLTAGNSLDVAVALSASIDSFSSGGDATLSGRSLDLGNGNVGGNLSAQAFEGDLFFVDLTVDGDGDLNASGSLLGGGIAAGGVLILTGADMDLASAAGVARLVADLAGNAFFTSLTSSGGAIALDAGGAARGGFATAAGAIAITGADVNLDFAEFGDGLILNARTGFLTGSGLYRGTGVANLQAAQGISMGSVDALGNIAMTAGAGAQFIELRSRDGSVNVNAGLEIGGSSVAATGSDAAGEDSVSLVAGRGILLDGAVNALNPVSGAQDDFIAQAARTLTIVRAEAGRDLSFNAGEGPLSAAGVSAGRDLSLTGPAVQLSGGSVARNLTIRATSGDITGSGTTTAGGGVNLDASGSIAIGALAANGGGLALASGIGGGISAGSLSTAGNLSVEAGSQGFAGAGLTATGAVDLASAGGVAFSAVNAGSSLDIDAGAAIAGGAVSARGSASVDANGAITLTGLTASNANVRSATGSVSATGIAVSGLLTARGTTVTLAAPGALQVNAQASGGNLGVTAAGNLTVSATATGDIVLTSSAGSVFIGSVGHSEGSSGRGIGVEAVSGGGAVAVTAANAISVADSLSAGGALNMTAGGLVSLAGSATGQTIDLRAGDLAIGSAGSLGSAATQRISLSSSAAVNLGAGASGGFAVDAGEFARIQNGGDLLVTALAGSGSGAGSLTLGSLTVNAGSGGQIGSTGTFGLTAAGVLDVNNILSIARAGSGNTLMLTGDAVDLDYANAALSVLDTANASTGRIVVNGRLITSLSAAAAADIAGKTPAEINTRLGLADVVRDIGLFRTGSLTLEGRDAILIQNSGGATVDERRGLTVGALTVTGAANGQTLVVINGIVNNATGNNAAQNVTVTNAIAAGSTVNGCVLANIAGCFVVIEPEPLVAPDSILFGISDFIQEDEEDDEVEDGVADGKTEAPPIDTTRIDDPAGLPMIDDPVTGAGNEDLWQPPED